MTDDNTILELVGLGVGSIRLRKSLATTDNILYLFGLDTNIPLVFTNSEGDEIDDISTAKGAIHVLTPFDLSDECPFSMDPSFVTDEMRMQTSIRIAKQQQLMRDARIEFIKNHYKPKRPELYSLERKFIDPEFLHYFDKGPKEAIQFMQQETKTKLFSFPFFTEEFCDAMVEEIEQYVVLNFNSISRIIITFIASFLEF